MVKGNDTVLFVAVIAFLLLATLPPLLFFAFYLDVVQLPSLSFSGDVAVAATIGVAVVASLFVVAAAAAMLARGVRRMPKKPKPEHYPWESYFGPAAEERLPEKLPVAQPIEPVAAKVERDGAYRATAPIPGRPGNAVKLVAASVVILLLVALVLVLASRLPMFDGFFGNVTNASKPAKDFAVVVPSAPASALANASSPFAGLADAAKKAASSVKNGIFKSASAVKSGILKIPDKAWMSASAVVVILLLAGALAVSYRRGELVNVAGWLGRWLVGMSSAFAAILRNKLKSVLGLAAIAVASAAAAAFVFRDRIKFPRISVGLPELPSDFSVGSALSSVKDFASAYRIYIMIGIFALLVIIAVIMLLERMGKKPVSP